MSRRRSHIPPPQPNAKTEPLDQHQKSQLEHYQRLEQRMESGSMDEAKEEFAAELAIPAQTYPQEQRFEQMDWHRVQGSSPAIGAHEDRERTGDTSAFDAAMFIGWAAFALSLASLFIMPRFLGAVAIILGVVAVFRGNRIGVWPVLIGCISIASSLLLLPFLS